MVTRTSWSLGFQAEGGTSILVPLREDTREMSTLLSYPPAFCMLPMDPVQLEAERQENLVVESIQKAIC